MNETSITRMMLGEGSFALPRATTILLAVSSLAFGGLIPSRRSPGRREFRFEAGAWAP